MATKTLPDVYNNARLEEQARVVADLLGEGWSYTPVQNDSLWCIFHHIAHTDGRILSLQMEENRPTRLLVYGMIRDDRPNLWLRRIGETITMGANKTATQIQGEISRRLLPTYDVEFAKETQAMAAQAEFDARKAATKARLTATGLNFDSSWSSSGDRAHMGSNFKGYGEVRVNGPDSIDLHIRGVDPETALTLIAVIRE